MSKIELNHDIAESVKSKVYNALSNIAQETFENTKISPEEQEAYIDQAYQWFLIHFFE